MALSQEQIDSLEILRETRKVENALTDRLEMIRVARDILIENSRNAPVGERKITGEDVVGLASTLVNFVNN